MGELLFALLTFTMGYTLVKAGGYGGGAHFDAETQVSHGAGGYGGASHGVSVGFGVPLSPIGLLGAIVPHVGVSSTHHTHTNFEGHGSQSHGHDSSHGNSWQGASGHSDEYSFQTAENLNFDTHGTQSAHHEAGFAGHSGAHVDSSSQSYNNFHSNRQSNAGGHGNVGVHDDSSFQAAEDLTFHELRGTSATLAGTTSAHAASTGYAGNSGCSNIHNSHGTNFEGFKDSNFQTTQEHNTRLHGSTTHKTKEATVDVHGAHNSLFRETGNDFGQTSSGTDYDSSSQQALNAQTAHGVDTGNRGAYGTGSGSLSSTDYLDGANHGSSGVEGAGVQSFHHASTHSDSSFQSSSYESSLQTHQSHGSGHAIFGSVDIVDSKEHSFSGANAGVFGSHQSAISGHANSNLQTAQDLNIENYGTHVVGAELVGNHIDSTSHSHTGSSAGEFNNVKAYDDSSFQAAQDLAIGFHDAHNTGTEETYSANSHVASFGSSHGHGTHGSTAHGVHGDSNFQSAQDLGLGFHDAHSTATEATSSGNSHVASIGNSHGHSTHGSTAHGFNAVGVHGDSNFQSAQDLNFEKHESYGTDVGISGNNGGHFDSVVNSEVHGTHGTNVGGSNNMEVSSGSSFQSAHTKSDSQFIQHGADVGVGGLGNSHAHNSHEVNTEGYGSHSGGFHTYGESSSHSGQFAGGSGYVDGHNRLQGGHGHTHGVTVGLHSSHEGGILSPGLGFGILGGGGGAHSQAHETSGGYGGSTGSTFGVGFGAGYGGYRNKGY